jgi:hypothetical protein
MVESAEAEASKNELGSVSEPSTQVIDPPWPLRTEKQENPVVDPVDVPVNPDLPDFRIHVRTVPSVEDDAKATLESQRTQLTREVCPERYVHLNVLPLSL